MNYDHMASQISVMIATTKAMEQNFILTAMKNDGTIDKEEQRMIDKIKKLNSKYIKELEKLKP